MPASWTRDTCNQPFVVANLGGFTSFWRAFSGLIGDGIHKLFPDTSWSQPAPKTKRRTKVLNLFWLLAILFHQFLTLTINTIHDSSHLKWTRWTPWLILTSSWHVFPFTDNRVKFTIFAWSPSYILLSDGFLPLKWTQWFPNHSVMVGISFSLGVLPLNLHPSSVACGRLSKWNVPGPRSRGTTPKRVPRAVLRPRHQAAGDSRGIATWSWTARPWKVTFPKGK